MKLGSKQNSSALHTWTLDRSAINVGHLEFAYHICHFLFVHHGIHTLKSLKIDFAHSIRTQTNNFDFFLGVLFSMEYYFDFIWCSETYGSWVLSMMAHLFYLDFIWVSHSQMIRFSGGLHLCQLRGQIQVRAIYHMSLVCLSVCCVAVIDTDHITDSIVCTNSFPFTSSNDIATCFCNGHDFTGTDTV